MRVAPLLAAVVLLVLTGVKPLGGIPYVGAAAFTAAAVLQLYLPLWRIDRLGLDHAYIGLHLDTWKRDARLVALLMLVTFPPYIVGHYLFMTQGHDWAVALGADELARHIPRLRLNLHGPTDVAGWLGGAAWLLPLIATHTLGVALPEETFYRGYLQPRLEHRWPAARRWLGVPVGRAALLAAFLFALGHFLGEWNPLRFGPLFPALIFAWQRNATGSVIGAIGYHAACNLASEILSTQYVSG